MAERSAARSQANGTFEEADAAATDIECATFECTELGNAARFVRRHGEEVRFLHGWHKWFVWDGARWKVDATAEVERMAKDVVRAISREASTIENDRERTKLNKHAITSSSAKSISALLRLAASEPGVPLLAEDLDRDAFLLNVKNGTIDLRTGKLRPHQRADLITKLAPVDFDGAAACPLWEAFIRRVVGEDESLISFLQRAVGYALTGDVGAQLLFFFHGAGANGKTTLLNTVCTMLGDYAVTLPFETLIASRAERHTTTLTLLHGARLAECQEVNEGQRFDIAKMKGLTGGGKITARRMREDDWSWTPTHKLFLAANTRPRVSEVDEATRRRIVEVPFLVTIPESERDPQLSEKLTAELPGIFAWAVRGCLDWQRAGGGRAGLGIPRRVEDATADYFEREDLLGAFLEEMCIVDPRHRVNQARLHEAFCAWCERANESPISNRDFYARIEQRPGISRDKAGGERIFRGIALKGAPIQSEIRQEVARA